MNTNTARASECCVKNPCCSMDQSIAKIPSDFWIAAALGSIGFSLMLKLNGRRDDSRFVGDWAAPFLLLGVYTKLVKLSPRSSGTSGASNESKFDDGPCKAGPCNDGLAKDASASI